MTPETLKSIGKQKSYSKNKTTPKLKSARYGHQRSLGAPRDSDTCYLFENFWWPDVLFFFSHRKQMILFCATDDIFGSRRPSDMKQGGVAHFWIFLNTGWSADLGVYDIEMKQTSTFRIKGRLLLLVRNKVQDGP